MLGDKIGEESGEVTTQRVLPNPGGAPKMETTFQVTGTLLGVGHKTTGTYTSIMRPDGTLFGEGQAIVMGNDGNIATWVGQGIGTIKKDGSVSYRGAIYYQTSATKWARLNSVAVVFEYEVDAQGNTSAQSWEWK
ncbi:MAG: hypothetical protein ACHQ6U_00665 [Thermodesulfobacteriota bacterium]